MNCLGAANKKKRICLLSGARQEPARAPKHRRLFTVGAWWGRCARCPRRTTLRLETG